MDDKPKTAFCVWREQPETIDEVRCILNAEYRYWGEQDSADSITAVGALGNVLASLNTGLMAPWHVKAIDEYRNTQPGGSNEGSTDEMA